MTWKPLILALFLIPMACKKAPECPRLSLHRFNLDGVADSVLWQYDEIYSGASVAEVERRQQRARQAGHDAWADNCRWLHQLTGCLAIKYYGPGTLPRWMTRDRHENPDRMLACLAHANEVAGCEWFLKDDKGQMIPVWPSKRPAMLLNLGPACPKGLIGDSKGCTVIEYMCGPWLDVFLKTRWKDVYDGVTIEDGPFPAVRCWGEGMDEILIVPGPGMEPMSCKDYRKYAFPHYSRFLTDCIGTLTRKGVITRCNGHFDYKVCQWKNPLLIEHAKLVHANFSAPKLEHVGNWGACPKGDLLKWTEILFRIEGNFQPIHPVADDYQGWDVGCVECGVRKHWPTRSVNNWQRAILAFKLMGETTFNVKCKDEQSRVVSLGPHALFKLGKPLGPAQVHRAGLKPVHYRHFKHKGQVYTVAWNPWAHVAANIPARDGEWFSGKWPDGEYKKLDIK